MLQAIKFGGTFKTYYKEGNEQTVSDQSVSLERLKNKAQELAKKYDVKVTVDTVEHNNDVFTPRLDGYINIASALPYKEATVQISPFAGKNNSVENAEYQFEQFLQDEYARNNQSA